MLGLYGLINLGARSLQAGRTGTEVTGHNIANANNPGYARQRLSVATSTPLPTAVGDQGNGVDVVSIDQVRDQFLDRQIQVEGSISGSLTAQQSALQQAEAALGQSLDTSASSGANSTSDATGTQHGLGEGINALFNEFQNVANEPSSLTERGILMMKAADLAQRFNQTDARLSAVRDGLNGKLSDDVAQANQLISEIAKLNHQITASTLNGTTANDLMDTRLGKIEELSKLIKVDVATGSDNGVDISVSGTTLVSGDQVAETLQTANNSDGQPIVQTAAGTPLSPSGGSIQGIIDVRDGVLKTLQDNINSLATNLITEVNNTHSAGFGLTGSSGALFFTGTTAADIAANKDLAENPALVQASGTSGAANDNQTMLAMAQLANQPIAGLNGQTFSAGYSSAVASLGQAAASVNSQLSDQKVVQDMLTQQRNSLSGVSLDEEMANMITYQKAFQASAKIVSMVDDMLSTVINMKQ